MSPVSMSELELKRVASSWIRMYRADRGSAERDKEFWSFERLYDLCHDDPENAWKIIVEIFINNPGDHVLANLAAGPVEDLLVYHGPHALAWIRGYCADEPAFVKVLQMVWQNAMSDEVWEGLNKLTGSVRR